MRRLGILVCVMVVVVDVFRRGVHVFVHVRVRVVVAVPMGVRMRMAVVMPMMMSPLVDMIVGVFMVVPVVI